MKNILFISDVFTDGGLEARIIEQIKTLGPDIRPFLLCRNLNPEHKRHFVVTAQSLTAFPDHLHLSSTSITDDVKTILNFCKNHQIDFIDCHPSWCLLPAALAAEEAQLPISFTLHGVSSGNFIDNQYLPAKALYDTILSYGFDQIFVVADYLNQLYNFLPPTQTLLNGFNLDLVSPKPFENTRRVAIASRLDPIKTKLILDFLPELLACPEVKTIDIYGAGEATKKLEDFITKRELQNKIFLQGWSNDLTATLHRKKYLAAFGMGRVIVDAISSGTPAGVLGYGGYAGLVTQKSLPTFFKTNLTSWQTSSGPPTSDLISLIKSPHQYLFQKFDLEPYSSQKIWQTYLRTISKTKHKPNPSITKLHQFLLNSQNINLLTDQTVFTKCTPLLIDGAQPIDQTLFQAVLENHHRELENLKNQNATLEASLTALQTPPPPPPSRSDRLKKLFKR